MKDEKRRAPGISPAVGIKTAQPIVKATGADVPLRAAGNAVGNAAGSVAKSVLDLSGSVLGNSGPSGPVNINGTGGAPPNPGKVSSVLGKISNAPGAKMAKAAGRGLLKAAPALARVGLRSLPVAGQVVNSGMLIGDVLKNDPESEFNQDREAVRRGITTTMPGLNNPVGDAASYFLHATGDTIDRNLLGIPSATADTAGMLLSDAMSNSFASPGNYAKQFYDRTAAKTVTDALSSVVSSAQAADQPTQFSQDIGNEIQQRLEQQRQRPPLFSMAAQNPTNTSGAVSDPAPAPAPAPAPDPASRTRRPRPTSSLSQALLGGDVPQTSLQRPTSLINQALMQGDIPQTPFQKPTSLINSAVMGANVPQTPLTPATPQTAQAPKGNQGPPGTVESLAPAIGQPSLPDLTSFGVPSPSVPQTSQAPQVPQVPQTSQESQAPQATQESQAPQVPQVPQVPQATQTLQELQTLQVPDTNSTLPTAETPATLRDLPYPDVRRGPQQLNYGTRNPVFGEDTTGDGRLNSFSDGMSPGISATATGSGILDRGESYKNDVLRGLQTRLSRFDQDKAAQQKRFAQEAQAAKDRVAQNRINERFDKQANQLKKLYSSPEAAGNLARRLTELESMRGEELDNFAKRMLDRSGQQLDAEENVRRDRTMRRGQDVQRDNASLQAQSLMRGQDIRSSDNRYTTDEASKRTRDSDIFNAYTSFEMERLRANANANKFAYEQNLKQQEANEEAMQAEQERLAEQTRFNIENVNDIVSKRFSSSKEGQRFMSFLRSAPQELREQVYSSDPTVSAGALEDMINNFYFQKEFGDASTYDPVQGTREATVGDAFRSVWPGGTPVGVGAAWLNGLFGTGNPEIAYTDTNQLAPISALTDNNRDTKTMRNQMGDARRRELMNAYENGKTQNERLMALKMLQEGGFL